MCRRRHEEPCRARRLAAPAHRAVQHGRGLGRGPGRRGGAVGLDDAAAAGLGRRRHRRLVRLGAPAPGHGSHALPARHEVLHRHPGGPVEAAGDTGESVPGPGLRVDPAAHAAQARFDPGRCQALRAPWCRRSGPAPARPAPAGARPGPGCDGCGQGRRGRRRRGQLAQPAASLSRPGRLAHPARRRRARRAPGGAAPVGAHRPHDRHGHHARGQDAPAGAAGHPGHSRRQGHHRDRPQGRRRPDAAHVRRSQARRPGGSVLPVPPGLPGHFGALQRHRQLRAHHGGGHARHQRPALVGQLGGVQGILLALLEHRGAGPGGTWSRADLRIPAARRHGHRRPVHGLRHHGLRWPGRRRALRGLA